MIPRGGRHAQMRLRRHAEPATGREFENPK